MSEINQRITEVTLGLSRLSKEGFDIVELAKIWAQIPNSTQLESFDYYESARNCIENVSTLVDNQFPALPNGLKTAKKLRLLAGLLELKAAQIESIN
ncbi:MAG: hypothetical protein ACD_30C00015G0001 [uncultured bacterium]|uniref:Uncharacterized protein n=3 Tax=Candidatus Daviesiibacteriota TaxID=1752718 RepID=A0A0G0I165_9BACT|nr:MAG: hypothetical protein ACD_30C00015G0001 [uncultured bacterium]KKQ09851.1 MAG: hypothetical protein US19_C0010G0032 [Candidatus Daviesbacteria bacterium GW2011_GWB1_36_5]KKQ14049.1 MAG: hypothetical protein US28_C0041G0011 [Candidatus Daviesbacteria bacterium GW2011_GWA1_36_8]OGE31494.1 MAG: hypothetical protein A3C99_03075 [Candidatus Daviesbacteria bacterium RIFCSPHIGHO2_02_FULL_37_9]OGE36339.1 MAG: hypothetical protein A3E66_05575 [Candidatus Daviesbacteria bacterium RIFCSPHIGHO2_12_FU